MLRVLIAAAVLVAAGCGGSEEAGSWGGPEELRPRDGVMDVQAFASYAESVDEDWERRPAALAREFLGHDEGVVSVDGARVVVLSDGLEDDSVRAERWVLQLLPDGDVWELVAARWEQRCHDGRGHENFSAELCV